MRIIKLSTLTVLFISIHFKSITQTCVVVIPTKNAIYIGADSRTTNFKMKWDKIDTIRGITCKIKTVGNYNYVNIGRFSDLANQIADSICKIDKSGFNNVMIKFNNEFRSRCFSLLSLFKKNNPTYYKSVLTETIMSQIIFIGYEEDSITIGHLVYWTKQNSDGVITVYSKLIPPVGRIVAGDTQGMSSFLEESKNWNLKPEDEINKIIKYAALINPNTVSEPVDILKVSPEKSIWIKKKKNCN